MHPFSVQLKKIDLKRYRSEIMTNLDLTPKGRLFDEFNQNHQELIKKFDIHKTLTVYPLPGFYYTTDYEVAKAYFKGLK
jgi:hypothetical protein